MEFLAETASVRAMAIAPTQPQRLYAASQTGVHRTDDRGVNWTPIPTPDEEPVLAIAVSPTNADHVWVSSGTIHRSTDAGASWAPSADTVPDGVALFVDSSTPSTLYAASSSASDGGIYKSTDNGDTWTHVWNVARAHDLAAHSSSPGTIVAATDPGLARTTDAGATWTLSSTANVVYAVEWPASDATRVYYEEQSYGGQLSKSTDAGATFVTTPGTRGGYSYRHTLAAHPFNADMLISAGMGYGCTYLSEKPYHWSTGNAGTSWSNPWTDPTCSYSGVSELIYDPTDANRLYRAEYGQSGSGTGFRTSSNGGSSFATALTGLGSHTAFGRLYGSKGVTYVIKGGDRYRTTNFLNFTAKSSPVDVAYKVQISPHNANVVLESGAKTYGGDVLWNCMQRSTDGMTSWSPWPALMPIGVPSNLGTPRAFMNPAAGVGVFVIVNSTLYRSTDSGYTFSSIGTIRGDAELLLVTGTWQLFSADDMNSVQFSDDAGESFVPRNSGLPPGKPHTLFLSPTNGSFLVALYEGGQVYETVDAGVTWTLRNTLGISDPFTSIWGTSWDQITGHVYVATNKGLFTADPRVVKEGLPSDDIYSVHYDPTNKALQVAVRYQGMFWQTLSSALDTPEVVATVQALRVAPNPFADRTTLEFQVPSGGANVILEIVDVAGRRIRSLRNGTLTAGSHSVVWNGKDSSGRQQAPGIFFARLVRNGDVSVSKVVRLN